MKMQFGLRQSMYDTSVPLFDFFHQKILSSTHLHPPIKNQTKPNQTKSSKS